MSQTHNITSAAREDKDDIIHADVPAIGHELTDEKPIAETQRKSTFDTLTTRSTISIFRKTVFICLLAGFCAATDGGSLIFDFPSCFLSRSTLTMQVISIS